MLIQVTTQQFKPTQFISNFLAETLKRGDNSEELYEAVIICYLLHDRLPNTFLKFLFELLMPEIKSEISELAFLTLVRKHSEPFKLSEELLDYISL